MVSFGSNSKKKAATSTTANDSAAAAAVVVTPNSSPSKASKNVTPKTTGGGFFRKALGGSSTLVVKNEPLVSTTPTTKTPNTTTSPVMTPDGSPLLSKTIKERPTVDTIDIPLSSKVPSTPNHHNIMREGHSLFDSPDNMYRIDSVLSDLSGSIVHTLPTNDDNNNNHHHNNNEDEDDAGPLDAMDPPALILRTSSIEAASGSSGYVAHSNSNTNSRKDSTTAPTTTTAESIVTKVLGIVDMSCVSSGLVPSTPTRSTFTTSALSSVTNYNHQNNTDKETTTTPTTTTTTIKPAYSFQPEWGVAPEDEDATVPEQKSLGSGGGTTHSGSPNNIHSNSANTSNNNNNNSIGSSVKRDLAKIAARASAPSTGPLNGGGNGDANQNNKQQQYRRYHETFELVYTEPTGKTNKKTKTTNKKVIPAATRSKIFTDTATSSSSNSAQSSKGLRINQWVTNKWNAKKQTKTIEKEQQPQQQPRTTQLPTKTIESPPVVPVNESTAVAGSTTTPASQADSSAKNALSPLDFILEPDVFSPRINCSSKQVTTASMTVETATTGTSTTRTTPQMDSSSSSNISYNTNSSVVENIETTKGVGGSENNNTTVVVMATTGNSSINVTTFPDESKRKKVGESGKSKTWYRFNKSNPGAINAKKEKKLVGFDITVGGGPKINNRTSPVKKKRFKSKGTVNNNKINAIDVETKSANPTKIILKSIKSSSMGLETVNEEDYVDDNTELKVRVPGFQNEDSYLSDHDLIGSEVVEEIYTDLNKSIEREEVEQQQQQDLPPVVEDDTRKIQGKLAQTLTETTLPNIVNDKNVLPITPVKITSDGYQKYCDASNDRPAVSGTVQHPRSKSWKERLGLMKGEVEHAGVVTVVAKAMPKSELVKSDSIPVNKERNKSKPQWKATIDPVTSKTYYYHKKTRETTWTKPPDGDVIPPKTATTSTTANVSDDGDEIDRAMQSNASLKPIPTPTVAGVLDAVVDVPLKKNETNDDRMASDVAAPDETNGAEEEFEDCGDEEDEFPQPQHFDVTDSNPFDEPIGETEYPDDERKKGDEKSMTTTRTRTTTSIYSGFSSRFSTKSRISEVTQPIKNLSSNKPKIAASHASISTKQEDLPMVKESILRNRRPTRIPKNIPVPRLRELNVEEFTTRDRDYKDRTPRGPKLARHGEDTDGLRSMYSMSGNNHHDDGDIDDGDADKSTVSYAATDSISALSEADLSFIDRKEAYDDARRRALDRAIAQEDWDLAAKLSESMRTTLKTSSDANRSFPREWVQSEMDRFISENEWDAVAGYIAQVRAHANEASQKQIRNHLASDSRTNPVGVASQMMLGQSAGAATRNVQSTSSDVSGTSNPQKIFGARSQLQHRDLHSVDSHSSYSTTFDSEYTSESYEQRSEEKRPPAPISRPRQQEFAC